MDSSMEKNKIDTGDGRMRPNENSGADVPIKKVNDDDDSVDLVAEGKGKGMVVSGSDSTGDDPFKKISDLGNITTSGSSMNQGIIKQEISEVNDSSKEFVGMTKAVVDVRTKLNERLRQQNLPGGICIQKETSNDYKNMIKEVKTEHDKTMEQFNNSILGGGGNQDYVDSDHDHHDNLNQSGETATLTKPHGKDLVVSEESQELKKQPVDHVKTTTEQSAPSDHHLGN